MKSLRLWIAFTLFCVVAVPVVVFLGGLWLAGPYAGENGFLGMARTLYGDVLSGHAGAIGLLLSPVAIIAVWRMAFYARKLIAAQQSGSPAASAGQS
ncbi:MAG: hypothetical protein HKN56_01055 [Gammaproteobacteria bacterium]|nr:hypothetical protein [Gammaproteobacteria bacterium]